jgi:hypothetical protein
MNTAFNLGTITIPAGASVSVEFDSTGAAVSHNMTFHGWWSSIGVSFSEIPRSEMASYKFSRHLTMKDCTPSDRYSPTNEWL